MSSKKILRIATFNTFGIPASHTFSRMKTIGEKLASMNYDILGFQEVFLEKYSKVLLETLQFKYSSYFHSGLVGSGLLLASRYPLENIGFEPYALKGKPERISHGEYILTPGIGSATAQTPWGAVEVFITHLIANFSSNQYDEYFAHRCAQVFQLAEYVSSRINTSSGIILGDFNFLPHRIEYQLLGNLLDIRDAWAELHPGDHTPTVNENNLFVQARKPDLRKSEKIDYIFYCSGEKLDLKPQSISLSMINPFTSRTGEPMNYSDHYAVGAEFEIHAGSKERIQEKKLEQSSSSIDLANILTSGIMDARRRQRIQLALGSISIVALAMAWMIYPGKDAGDLSKSLVILASIIIGLLSGFSFWLASVTTRAEIRNLKSLLKRVHLRLTQTK